MGHFFFSTVDVFNELSILPCRLHLLIPIWLKLLSEGRLLFSDIDAVPFIELVLFFASFGGLQNARVSKYIDSHLWVEVTPIFFELPKVVFSVTAGLEGLKKFLILTGGAKAFFSKVVFTIVGSSNVVKFVASVNIGMMTGAMPKRRLTLFYKNHIDSLFLIKTKIRNIFN